MTATALDGVLTVGSLFSGIGGLDLGLERAGMRVVWQSEIDPYASRVLAKHWPTVPNHGDITKIDFTAVERVDVLCGGFPCQDLSNAGRRAGIDGARSGLWSEYVRAIRDLRPRYVLVENVSALLSGGDGDWFARVLGDLAESGFDAEWDCIPASAVGALHERERAWVLAHAQHARVAERWRAKAIGAPLRVAGGIRPTRPPRGPQQAFPLVAAGWALGVPARLSGWWATEPRVERVAYGVPDRSHRARGLGNAVVPQVAELIGGWIVAHALAMQEAAA